MFKLSNEKILQFIEQDLANIETLKKRVNHHINQLPDNLKPKQATAYNSDNIEEMILGVIQSTNKILFS